MKPNLENLKALVHCPVCSKEYRPAKILLLDQEDKRSTLHLTCEHCGASTLVYVSMSPVGVVSMGVLTDLEQGEARRLFKGEAISGDEVLTVHQFLKEHHGGVDELIR
jgi:transcription elongation factor Elf1